METLKTLLENRNIIINFKYYGVQDLSTGWEIKAIIENPDIFDDFCIKYPLKTVDNADDYYLFLIYRKIAAMEEVIPNLLHEEHKSRITLLTNSVKSTIDEIGAGPIIKYINKNISIIFGDGMSLQNIDAATLDIVAKYKSGIDKSVFSFLCKHYGYLLIDRFDDFENVFEKYPDLFSEMFPTGKLEEIDNMRFDTVLDIWNHIINKENSPLKNTVEKNIPVLFEDVRQLSETATINNIMQIEQTIQKFYLFLQQIRSPKANEFSKFAKAAEALLSQYLHERGQSYTYKVPVGEIIKKWKLQKEWEIRLLSLTHDSKIINGKIDFESRLSKTSEAKLNLVDLVSTNIATDNYYTMTHQQMLSIISSVGTGTIAGITQDNETLQDYLNLIVSAIQFISIKMNAEGEHLEHDSELLANMAQLVFNNSRSEKYIVNSLVYGASMYLCAFSEKILRLAYIYMAKNELYIPLNKATLGELLNVNNTYMVKMFGEDHIKNLTFFLIQVSYKGIGHNYRNSLAHWVNIEPDILTPMFAAQMLWLFTDILNTVFWFFSKESLLEK